MQTRFCCRHGPDVEWASARRLALVADLTGRLGHPDQPGGHDRVGGQGAARGVDGHVVAQAQRRGQQWLLVREGGLDLGHLDRAVLDAGGGRRGAHRAGQA